MAEHTDLRNLLVLQGPNLQSEGILHLLREHFDVQMAHSLDAALDAMRRHPFDAVLAETGDFLPLERGAVTQQAAVILNTIGDGVCIVGPDGELVWANRRLREYPPAVLDLLRRICTEAYQQLAASGKTTNKKFSLIPDGGSYYEVICSPVCDPAGQLRQVVAVVVDATMQRRQQQKLNAIDKAGRELVRLDYDSLCKLDATQRLAVLEERVIRGSREVLCYQHFAVHLLNERTNRLEVLVSEGMDAELHEVFASPEGNGITGYVAATGRSYICPDVSKDARYLRCLVGARSSLTVPLRLHDKVIGVLNVESDKAGTFTEEDRQFVEIFANYVAMALHILNLVIFARHNATTQITGCLCTELSGPLNDITSEVSELMEDYIGHDDLRKRLSAIIDHATTARKIVQQMANGPSTGVIAPPPGPVQADPILNGKRILVADDEELIRTTIRDVLLPYGCQIDLAGDGQQARQMLAQAKYDLVVSDITMPGATGYDVFSAAKTICPDTRVILMTGFGYDPNHSIVKANREGLSSVMMKPFRAKQLLEECRSALTPHS
ncbi:MAG: response regulator [Planctomycetaceae bacterium]|nr:MAG: response regulator [Planctomycetaceae bacterium]